jgi:hypothetical protein
VSVHTWKEPRQAVFMGEVAISRAGRDLSLKMNPFGTL